MTSTTARPTATLIPITTPCQGGQRKGGRVRWGGSTELLL